MRSLRRAPMRSASSSVSLLSDASRLCSTGPTVRTASGSEDRPLPLQSSALEAMAYAPREARGEIGRKKIKLCPEQKKMKYNEDILKMKAGLRDDLCDKEADGLLL